MLIYAITNTVNGKRYIGLTTLSLADRWSKHKWDAANGRKFAIHRAICKYGADKFIVEQIASLPRDLGEDELCALERLIIAQENTLIPVGYNMTKGGERADTNRDQKGKTSPKKGKPMPAAQLEELRAVWASPEHRAKMSARLTGIKKKHVPPRGSHSEEHRQHLREAWARNPERHVKQAEANRARVMSDQTRERMCIAARRPDRIEALRARNAVMNADPAHWEKISAGWAKSPNRKTVNTGA